MSNSTRESGQWAEDLAARELVAHGLKEIARNYRCALGELDLVMSDRQSLVFVEVRYRSDTRFGSAVETIGPRKQQRVIRTAQHYLQAHSDIAGKPCRFDVVVITGPSQRPEIEWIQGAFQA